MSKAFDSIKRKYLIDLLQNTINTDELFIVKKMLEVSLSVRCGDFLSDPFQTDTGTPQGDCASANSFTFYLAKALENQLPTLHVHQNHLNAIPDHLTELSYSIQTQIEHINIEMEYADDLSKITSDYANMQKYENEKPVTLCSTGLNVNNEKTERYTINKASGNWRKCKLLGTMLDTNEDIKRRKILAINAANNLGRFFDNSNLTIKTKLRLVQTYIEPIFLYNAETWTLTKTNEQSIDAFHRKIIRKYVFNVKWPRTLSNEALYDRSKVEPWRKKITRKRLNWFGKLAAMPDNTPANVALEYGLEKFQRPRGKPKTTWISKTKKDLESMNFDWDEAKTVARENLNEWFKIVQQYVKNLI